ncbi:MAG: hypothetical protein P8P30_10295 [Rickettsiales bacterium]|nr:hypothetical protein [Rickettsiales bacterium]
MDIIIKDLRENFEQLIKLRFSGNYTHEDGVTVGREKAEAVLRLSNAMYEHFTRFAIESLLREEFGTDKINEANAAEAREMFAFMLSKVQPIAGYNQLEILKNGLEEYDVNKTPAIFDRASHRPAKVYRKQECRLKLLAYIYFFNGRGDTLDAAAERVREAIGEGSVNSILSWKKERAIEVDNTLGEGQLKVNVDSICATAKAMGGVVAEYNSASEAQQKTEEFLGLMVEAQNIEEHYNDDDFLGVAALYRAAT